MLHVPEHRCFEKVLLNSHSPPYFEYYPSFTIPTGYEPGMRGAPANRMAHPSWQDGIRRTEKTIQRMFGHEPRRSRLNARYVSSRWSTSGKSLEEEHWIGDRVTHYGCILTQEHRSFRRRGSVVEGSRTGLTLDKHLNDNNSDRRPRRSTESNRKSLSKGIESPTVIDVGNTEALRGRQGWQRSVWFGFSLKLDQTEYFSVGLNQTGGSKIGLEIIGWLVVDW